MKIAVLSDTHLHKVTPEFERICRSYFKGADLVIHLGDWTNSDVLDYMMQFPLLAISGNSDGNDLRQRLPAKRIVRIGGYRVGLIHGWGASYDIVPRIRNEFKDVNIILFGHTHIPYQMTEHGVFWLNPGSIFNGRGDVERSFAFLYLDDQIKAEVIMI